MDKSLQIIYPAIFKQEENQICSVVFPDLEGCFSQGDNFEDAFIKAQEALAIYYHEKKGILPSASSIFDFQNTTSNSIVQMISVDLTTYTLKKISTKAVKKTLTIPEWLDVLSKDYNVNYSSILKEALIDYLRKSSKVSTYDKLLLNN